MDIEVPPAEGDRRFLLVRSGGSCYALPAGEVRQVVRGLAFHPLPGAQAHLLGLAQFAGEPLAVLDLHSMIDGAAPRPNHRATVILGRGRPESWAAVGLAVNEALRVQTIAGDSAAELSRDVIAETVELDGERVLVVNTSVLLGDHPQGEGNRDA